MYSIADYLHMVNDDIRTGQYINALKSVVNPGSVVLDIGTGTGIFALMACRFGARHVYAVDPDSSIQVAKHLAEVNGYSGKISFIQDLSTEISLPEKADIVVSDLRGVMPLFGQHLETVIDARERHLAPGGVLIPQRDTLWAALVTSPVLYQAYYTSHNTGLAGIDIEPACVWARNQPVRKEQYKDEYSLVKPQSWCTLDYHSITGRDVSGKLIWEVQKEGVAHGYRLWFDCRLTAEYGYSTGPDRPKTIYQNMFLPLSEPVDLRPGDVIELHLQANLVDEDYLWRWNTRLNSHAGHDQKMTEFRQSTFNGIAISLPILHKQAADYKPELNEDGRIKYRILALMNEGLELHEIAQKIRESFPGRFRNDAQALRLVSRTSVKYSK